jgi:hypothetical protein
MLACAIVAIGLLLLQQGEVSRRHATLEFCEF